MAGSKQLINFTSQTIYMTHITTSPIVVNETVTTTPSDNETPFVNEECGDTMWDAVLNQQEIKDQSALLTILSQAFQNH
jgi:hypothetical protein